MVKITEKDWEWEKSERMSSNRWSPESLFLENRTETSLSGRGWLVVSVLQKNIKAYQRIQGCGDKT